MSHQSQSDRLAPIVLNRLNILNQAKSLTRSFRRWGYPRRTLELPTGILVYDQDTHGNGRRQILINKFYLPSVRGRLADELCFHVKHGAKRNRQLLAGMRSNPCTQSLPGWGKDLKYSLANLLTYEAN
jgi:hypothetical protein